MTMERGDEYAIVQEQASVWVTAAQRIEANEASILVASTDPGAVWTLSEALRDENYQILLAHERALALRTIVWQLPDLVILDAQLANDDGIALCASLKADHRTACIPILIIAHAHALNERLRAIDAGADDYLPHAEITLIVARSRALLRARRISNLVPLDGVLKSPEHMVTAKDQNISAHQQHLAAYAVLIGERLRLRRRILDMLRLSIIKAGSNM